MSGSRFSRTEKERGAQSHQHIAGGPTPVWVPGQVGALFLLEVLYFPAAGKLPSSTAWPGVEGEAQALY